METDTTDKHETHRNEALIACLQRCSPVQLNFFDKTREDFWHLFRSAILSSTGWLDNDTYFERFFKKN